MKKFNVIIMISVLCLVLSGLITFGQKGSSNDKILGTYLTEDGTSKIEFFKSGDKFNGKIVWMKDPINAKTHKAEVDNENPDPAKRNIPVMGMVIVKNLSFNGKDEWENGSIYDPNTGRTWDCSVSIENGKLKVKGYWKFSWIGKTEKWSKVNKQLSASNGDD